MPTGTVKDDGDPGQLHGTRIGLIAPALATSTRIPFANGALYRTPHTDRPVTENPNRSSKHTWGKSDEVEYDDGDGEWEGWAVNLKKTQ